MARHRHRRQGSIAIQIIFVFFLIWMVVPLLSFRGIVKARGTAQKLRCGQQLRDMGLALAEYDVDKRSFPGYRNVLLKTNNESYTDAKTGQGGVSWVVPLLPYLDFQPIYDEMRTAKKDDEIEHPFIEMLVCPIKFSSELSDRPWLSYVANTGCIDVDGTPRGANSAGMPRDWAANGVFFDRYTGSRALLPADERGGENATKLVPVVTQSNSWISQRDGVAQTIMLSENLDHGLYADVYEPAVGMIWDIESAIQANQIATPGDPPPTATPTKRSYLVNSKRPGVAVRASGKPATDKTPYDYARPSSLHTNGANVVYCDAHVGFLKNQMEYFVYCLLMSADGKNVKKPGDAQALKNNWFKIPIDDAWFMPEY